MSDNNSLEKNMNSDSGVDIDLVDLEDISLDELDGLDGLDFDNLDLDDIDFDDLDVTSLDTDKTTIKPNKDDDDFDFDELLKDESGFEQSKVGGNSENSTNLDELGNESTDFENQDYNESVNLNSEMDVFGEAENNMHEDVSTPTNDDLDALFAAMEDDEEASGESADEKTENYTQDEDDLDALFQQSMEVSLSNGELDDIADIDDIKNVKGKKASKKKKATKDKDGSKEKKSLSEILFGEPDEDDAEEERLLEEKRAQKEILKAKKDAEKAEKKAKKQELLALKQRENEKKAKEKSDKKAKAEEEYRIELEAEKDTKKVSTAVVIIVFAAFAFLAGFVIIGTKNFDYRKVISKATEYFDRQRYRLAYDEIAGVEVKKKDEDLKDRIYTVMYVERLYESYENNITLGRPDKALDALIRGLEKYDEHYDEAVELGIVSDIDSCKDKIVNSLWNTYSITEEKAYVIMNMDGQDYTDALGKYCSGLE